MILHYEQPQRRLQSKVRLVVLLVSLMTSFYVIYNTIQVTKGFQLLGLLPFLYGLLYYFSNMWKAIFRYYSLTILNAIFLFRYVISPLTSSLVGIYYVSNAKVTGPVYNDLATLLMIYEMIIVFIFFHYGIKKLDHINENFKGKLLLTNYNNKMWYAILLLSVLSLILYPKIFDTANFIVYKDEEFPNFNALESFGLLFTQLSLKIIFLYVIILQYKRKLANKKVINIILLPIAFISSAIYWGGSRLSIIVNALLAIIILKQLNILNRYASIILVSLSLFSVVTITSLEYYGDKKLDSFSTNTLELFGDDQYLIDNLQAYFGGHHLIAIAASIENNPSNDIRFETLVNEVVGSIMFVRQIFPPNQQQTTVLFNKEFGFFSGNSMILPTLGQGYLYFGFIGSVLFSIVFCYILLKSEESFITSKTVGLKFSFLILITLIPFFPMQNINIISGSIFNVFFPFYVLNRFNN